METLVKTFKGKRVLVTGHTGFKGSWFSLWLTKLGAHVSGYALGAPSEPNFFTVGRLAERMQHVEGDIRDYSRLAQALRDAAPDYVFHFAAQPLVRASYETPKETFDTNVGGVVNLLEAIRHTPSVRLCINVTSDKCYENQEWLWGYRETDRLGGRDPYSTSKAAAELVTAAYRQSFFPTAKLQDHKVDIATVRAGNVIGGGDWGTDRVIPDAMRALAAKQAIRIRNPEAMRPWQHVFDCLYGYLTLAAQMIAAPGVHTGAWNFGPLSSNHVPVRQIIERVLHYWGGGQWEHVKHDGDGKHEAHFLHLNCDKAVNLLRWRPVWSLERSIEQLVRWYQEFYRNPAGIVAFSNAQIDAFMKDAQ